VPLDQAFAVLSHGEQDMPPPETKLPAETALPEARPPNAVQRSDPMLKPIQMSQPADRNRSKPAGDDKSLDHELYEKLNKSIEQLGKKVDRKKCDCPRQSGTLVGIGMLLLTVSLLVYVYFATRR
jgi:hypothetical protein